MSDDQDKKDEKPAEKSEKASEKSEKTEKTEKASEKSEKVEKASEKSDKTEKTEKSEKAAKKTAKKETKKDPADAYRVAPSSPWGKLWKTFAGFAALGLGGSAAGYFYDPKRFAFAWMFGFIVALTIAIGAMMFVMLHHLTNGSWGIVVRRLAEFFGAGTPIFVLLAIPVVLTMNTLFGEWLGTSHGAATAQPEHASLAPAETQAPLEDQELASNDDLQPRGPMRGGPNPFSGDPHGPGFHGRSSVDAPGPGVGHPGPSGATIRRPDSERDRALAVEHQEVMGAKKWYLNKNFFYGRLVAYLLFWLWLGPALLRISSEQDKSKDPNISVRLNRLSAPGVILLSLTLTFAAFDWIMSLDPTWYSTIFGVVFFASSMVCIFAVLILTLLGMREDGVLAKEVTIEHYHDLGKLLFGFMCFWAYVAFSQFMLIWYAAIPEEVTFYHARWDIGPWRNVSLAIVLLHFCIPFVFIMSRNVKRNLGMLRIGTITLLVMHIVDMYWLIMPAMKLPDFAPSWIDGVCLIGPVCAYLAVVFYTMTKYPILPIGDPRLLRSLKFENA